MRRGFRGHVQARELRPRLLQRRSGLNGEQPPESIVDRGKKNFKEASVRNESLSSSLVRLDRGLLRNFEKTLFDGLLGARRGIESELENGRSQRPEPKIPIVESRTCAQVADVGERVAQERIVALETLGQFLFNFGCSG